MALEPSLWGTLPKELLDLVFVGLPVAGIGQFRVLSKEWKWNVDCKDLEFNQVLDATMHLNMFALLPIENFGQTGYIYDVQTPKCHIYELDADFQTDVICIGADGGLVCFISRLLWAWCHINEVGVCYVMNPLTKPKMQLPPFLCMWGKTHQRVYVRMLKLTMDKKTEKYQVFVLGSQYIHGATVFFAQVYDSHMKKWMVVEATHGRIIGCDYLHTLEQNIAYCDSLCVYNCVDGTLHHFHRNSIAPGLNVERGCCVLLEDHLFVLHKETSLGHGDVLEDSEYMLPKYCISEFYLPERVTTWVKLKVHNCGPCKCFLEKPPGIVNLRLMGCNGFLLVYGIGCKPAWLYNLSTYEWRNLPTFEKPIGSTMMCTISWSAMV